MEITNEVMEETQEFETIEETQEIETETIKIKIKGYLYDYIDFIDNPNLSVSRLVYTNFLPSEKSLTKPEIKKVLGQDVISTKRVTREFSVPLNELMDLLVSLGY